MSVESVCVDCEAEFVYAVPADAPFCCPDCGGRLTLLQPEKPHDTKSDEV